MALFKKKERKKERKKRITDVKCPSKILLQGCRKRMLPQSAMCQNWHA